MAWRRRQLAARSGVDPESLTSISSRAPLPSNAVTSVAIDRNAGYSQPPLAEVKSQPLPACAHVAPIRTGISPIATARVFTPVISRIPPTSSAAKVA